MPPSNILRLTPATSPLSPPPQNIFQPITHSAPPLSSPSPYSNTNATRATTFGEAVSSPLSLKLSDEILNVLNDAENVLKTDYISEKALNEKDIEEIKKEYNSDDIKNELDDGNVPSVLEFLLAVKVKISM